VIASLVALLLAAPPTAAPPGPAPAPAPAAAPTAAPAPVPAEPLPGRGFAGPTEVATPAGVEPPAPEGPAALPDGAPLDPASVGAVGVDGFAPLPAPPKPEPPQRVRRGAWRGKGWIELGLDVSITPLGRGPERRVVSLGAGLGLGVRLHRALGVFTGIGTFVNGVERRRYATSDGAIVLREDVGRIFVWDVAVLRAFVPTKGRFQPYADLGGGLGVDRPPFSSRPRAMGTLRAGLGHDIWLGPTTTLGVFATYRLLGARRDVQHALAFGAALGFHW
jgi:hypothetical protein